ncbi:monocyte chemotactic protein 1B-like [Myripristis murdjan]|uniref:monocyte chemotactic protein 1B-like n=1 Tax=Myripristis murdjan TaxID=586833 RepID=UPI001175ECF7|nr:monocyte chemotactic protein 1B-like [Myripristis murdjan]
MTSLTFLSLLLLTTVVSTISAQGGLSDCCHEIKNTTVHRDRLMGYIEVRPPICGLHAVIFRTVLGKRICADPKRLWTLTSKAYLDGKNYYRRQAKP